MSHLKELKRTLMEVIGDDTYIDEFISNSEQAKTIIKSTYSDYYLRVRNCMIRGEFIEAEKLIEKSPYNTHGLFLIKKEINRLRNKKVWKQKFVKGK